jgi:protein angel
MKFVVATTHLLYNPRRQDIRLAQIQILLAELDRISRIDNTNEYLPVMLTGDFNLQPYSAPFELITKGNLSYANLTQRTLNSNSYNNPTNGRKLLPIKLGITDNCKHVNNVRHETKVSFIFFSIFTIYSCIFIIFYY